MTLFQMRFHCYSVFKAGFIWENDRSPFLAWNTFLVNVQVFAYFVAQVFTSFGDRCFLVVMFELSIYIESDHIENMPSLLAVG